MKHALIVGGSGMLAKTSLWLADNGYLVSVVGRNIYKLKRLSDSSKNIIPISVNYYNESQFRSEINKSINTNGTYEIVVAWIHSNEKNVIDIISNEIRDISNTKWRLFHVLGSSSNLEEILREIDDIENCDYHQVQLGFISENDKSRWLTHDEISDGVINCISTNSKKYLVGKLTPWNKRP